MSTYYTPEQVQAVCDAASEPGATPFKEHYAAVKLGARIQDGPYDPRLIPLIKELVEHLDYIGWGDSYEREPVVAPGGLRDRTAAILREAGVYR
jgi:hypothetical protein